MAILPPPQILLRPLAVDQVAEAPEDREYLDFHLENVTGTPLVIDATHSYRTLSGREIPGLYTGRFVPGSVAPGVDGEVEITTTSPHNPYGMSIRNAHTVPLTGALTEAPIPGLALGFNDSLSFADTWEFDARVGLFLPEVDQGNPLEGGDPILHMRYAVENMTGQDLIGCYAVLRQPVLFANLAGQGVFDDVHAWTNGATEQHDNSTGRILRYEAVPTLVVSGSPRRADIKFGRVGTTPVAVNVRDLEDTTGSVFSSVNGATGALICDGRGYEIQNQGLAGVRVYPRTDLPDTDVGSLVVYERRGSSQAVDSIGLAGSFSQADVPLTTQDGSSSSGTVRAGTFAYGWVDIDISEDFPPNAPYLWPIYFRARTTNTVGILD